VRHDAVAGARPRLTLAALRFSPSSTAARTRSRSRAARRTRRTSRRRRARATAARPTSSSTTSERAQPTAVRRSLSSSQARFVLSVSRLLYIPTHVSSIATISRLRPPPDHVRPSVLLRCSRFTRFVRSSKAGGSPLSAAQDPVPERLSTSAAAVGREEVLKGRRSWLLSAPSGGGAGSAC
jgi:hypothetical protein